MTFLLTILEWVAGQILRYLLGRATDAVLQKAQEVERDRQRERINESNVKAYDEASARYERIAAAERLLNRVSKP